MEAATFQAGAGRDKETPVTKDDKVYNYFTTQGVYKFSFFSGEKMSLFSIWTQSEREVSLLLVQLRERERLTSVMVQQGVAKKELPFSFQCPHTHTIINACCTHHYYLYVEVWEAPVKPRPHWKTLDGGTCAQRSCVNVKNV